MNNPENKGRRGFLNWMLGTTFGGLATAVFYPVWKYLQPPKGVESNPSSVLAGTISEMKPNSGKIIKYGSKPVILLRTPEGDFKAYTAICTHLACIVQYREDFEHIWCACHNGHYDLQGRNISGPPPRPLDPYEVHVKEEKIFVSRIT